MLTPEDRAIIAGLLSELAAMSGPTVEDMLVLIARVPPRQEAYAYLVEQALGRRELPRQRVLALREAVRRSGPPASLAAPHRRADLSSGGPAREKIGALMRAVREQEPGAADAIRQGIGAERDPFVLATMASALGRLGCAADAMLLIGLLENEDARVVANALEALGRLGACLPVEGLTRLIERSDGRVRSTALALLGRVDVGRVLEALWLLSASARPAARAGAVHALGELLQHPRAVQMLLSLFEHEEDPSVLRRIAASVKKCALVMDPKSLVGSLHELRGHSAGGKHALIAELLQELAVELGMVEEDVERIGRERSHDMQPSAGSYPVRDELGSLPVAPRMEGDADLSFAAAWGPPSGGAVCADPASGSCPASAGIDDLARMEHIERVKRVQTRSRPATIPPPGPVPGRRRTWIPAVALLAATLVLVIGLSRGAGGIAPSVAARKDPRPSALPSKLRTHGPRERAPQATAGTPVGSPVELDGRVVSASRNRMIVRSGAQYYVVGGRELEDYRAGQVFRGLARMMGTAPNGLIRVDVARR